jgi:hypothetical protein
MERRCLTSGLVFSGALNPGNWGIAVVEDILNGRMCLAIDDRSGKNDVRVPLL